MLVGGQNIQTIVSRLNNKIPFERLEHEAVQYFTGAITSPKVQEHPNDQRSFPDLYGTAGVLGKDFIDQTRGNKYSRDSRNQSQNDHGSE